MNQVVDVHTHCMATGLEAQLPGGIVERRGRDFLATLKGIPMILYADALDIEKQVRVSAAAGVTKRLLSDSMLLATYSEALAKPASDLAQQINDRMASYVARFPDQLFGLGTVCPLDARQLPEADRCIDRLGFKGIIVDTSWQGRFLDGEDAYPFWEWAEARKVTVFLHPPQVPIGADRQMDQYKLEESVGRPFDTAMSAARLILSGVLDRYPNLKLHLAHMGGGVPMVISRMDMGQRLGYDGLPGRAVARCNLLPSEYLRRNFWADCMGFSAPGVRHMLEIFGVDRILLGTDYGPVPIRPIEHIKMVESLALSEDDKAKILWKNADRLYDLQLAGQPEAAVHG